MFTKLWFCRKNKLNAHPSHAYILYDFFWHFGPVINRYACVDKCASIYLQKSSNSGLNGLYSRNPRAFFTKPLSGLVCVSVCTPNPTWSITSNVKFFIILQYSTITISNNVLFRFGVYIVFC